MYSYGSVFLQVSISHDPRLWAKVTQLTCTQVLSGDVPYHYIKKDILVAVELHKGVYPKRPEKIWVTDGIWHFINQCWAEPAKRPRIQEIGTFMKNCFKSCEAPTGVVTLTESLKSEGVRFRNTLGILPVLTRRCATSHVANN